MKFWLAATGDRENIFDSITRRKLIEALGRRRDLSTLPTIYDAMSSRDEQTIVNAIIMLSSQQNDTDLVLASSS